MPVAFTSLPVSRPAAPLLQSIYLPEDNRIVMTASNKLLHLSYKKFRINECKYSSYQILELVQGE
jgi:hypothetical protein